MIRNFIELMENTGKRGGVTVCVAAAQDEEVLRALKEAHDIGIASAILVGDEDLIRPLAEKAGLPPDTPIVHEPDPFGAAAQAVKLVKTGEASVLMKGLINSGDFLKAVVDREAGLRNGSILNHVAAFEIPGERKLVFHTDGGMNIAPTLEEKRQILANTIKALNRMGIDRPNVAVLAANEQVNPKMPVTVDARALAEMARDGRIPPCVIEGPIAMDVAASRQAAGHKGINSLVSGDVDIFLMPSIEAGNFVGKTLVYYAGAKIAGVILGATNPVVMTSRADDAEAKLNSIALACLVA